MQLHFGEGNQRLNVLVKKKTAFQISQSVHRKLNTPGQYTIMYSVAIQLDSVEDLRIVMKYRQVTPKMLRKI